MKEISYFESTVSRFVFLYKSYKVPFLSSMIAGLLAYSFAFTNKLPNLDDVYCFVQEPYIYACYGRWMLSVIKYLFPLFPITFVFGVISLFIIAIANCFIVEIYNIKRKTIQVLLCGIITTFPSFISALAYWNTSIGTAFGFLFCILSVYFFQKRAKKNMTFAFVFLLFSLAIYQAFVALVVSLFLVLFIQKLLFDSENVKNKLILGCKYIAFIALSVIVYLLINKLVFLIFDIEFNTYANDYFSDGTSIFKRLIIIYASFYNLCFLGTYGIFNHLTSNICQVIIILIAFICAARELYKRNKKVELLILFVLFILYPIAINNIIFLAPTGSHTITMIGYISLYVFVAYIVDELFEQKRMIIYDCCMICMALMLSNNVIVSNEAHYKQYMQYQQAYSFWTRVITRIEQNPRFVECNKIAIIGRTNTFLFDYNPVCPYNITGIAKSTIINYYSRNQFVRYYIGFDFPFATDEDINNIILEDSFKEMPEYPYYGSVQKIGDIMVVKMGNEIDFAE